VGHGEIWLCTFVFGNGRRHCQIRVELTPDIFAIHGAGGRALQTSHAATLAQVTFALVATLRLAVSQARRLSVMIRLGAKPQRFISLAKTRRTQFATVIQTH
ncbi:MAG: hypothetical protein WBH04_17660, partial [Albidovulum sp.]